MMAYHEHVKMFVERVAREWTSWVGARREHIRMGNDSDDIWSMATPRTFRVVCTITISRIFLGFTESFGPVTLAMRMIVDNLECS